jgi:hypothetical protein
LRPGQRVRYVAGDLSPVTLRRARAEANPERAITTAPPGGGGAETSG